MGRSRINCEIEVAERRRPSLARTLAPEEVAVGDFVALLFEVIEWPSWFWCDDALLARDEPVRVCHWPREEPQPLRVRGICLPFVLVKAPAGGERTLDVRRCRLARLDRRFARAAWRSLRQREKRAARLARSPR